MNIRGSAAVVGIAEVDTFQAQERSPVGLMALAAKRACDDAGISIDDVDGIFSASSVYYSPTLTLAEYLKISPRYSDSTVIGGASFEAHIGHAVAAINAGLCDYALVVYGSTQRSDGGGLVSMSEWSPYEEPLQMRHPLTSMGLIATRHMHEFGTTRQELAAVATSAREWAMGNPRAPYRQPLTIDDVVTSRVIASPLRKYDCCLVTDGAAAVIVCSAERAASLRHEPSYVLGVGEAPSHRHLTGMGDLVRTTAGRSSDMALRMAGVSLKDLDVACVYDAFTISLLILLEDIGFVPKGEGGAFVASGAIRPGGSLALNPNGGGLSFTHPGMLGLFLLTETVRQLRGQAIGAQIPDAEIGLAHGMGFNLAAHATVVLGTESAL